VSSSHATLFREFPDDEGDGGDGGPPAPVLYVLDTSTNGTFIKARAAPSHSISLFVILCVCL
jgi:hypothetical protein